MLGKIFGCKFFRVVEFGQGCAYSLNILHKSLKIPRPYEFLFILRIFRTKRSSPVIIQMSQGKHTQAAHKKKKGMIKTLTNMERFANYVKAKQGQVKLFALLAKGSTRGNEGSCLLRLYTPERLLDALEKGEPGFDLNRPEGIRWKAPQVNKTPRDPVAEITVDHAWTGFALENGSMADAQERAVVDALNSARVRVMDHRWDMLVRLQWQHTGRNHRRGIFDAKATLPDGTVLWVEVKGRNGRMYFS